MGRTSSRMTVLVLSTNRNSTAERIYSYLHPSTGFYYRKGTKSLILNFRAKSLRPIRLNSPTSSTFSEGGEECIEEETENALTMASEYQLRQRDSCVRPNQFR